MNKCISLLIATAILTLNSYSQEPVKSPGDYIIDRSYDSQGNEIVGIVVPGKPPEKHREPPANPSRSAVLLNNVPAFDWSFGCSATSAAMIAGYYDNSGYPGMYSGPTNYGFMPMNNSIWGSVVINGETLSLCPLSATRNNLDGRTTNGHVDDYWILYNNPGPDPFIVNGWTEHTHGDCTGDYMKTNQSTHNNVDGGTKFYFYSNGAPYSSTFIDDGCNGLHLFFESRGYTVTGYYSQYIYGFNGNTLGFTFNQYKNEINNGRPVLIQVEGHTMVGMGYDDTGTLVYLHDTWDYSIHTMTWGGSYSNMAHYAVSVVQLGPSGQNIVANFESGSRRELVNTTISFTDISFGNPTGWNWSIEPSTYNFTGGTTASSQNPQVLFTQPGLYTVTLTASSANGQDSETKTNYIETIDCNNFLLPLQEDFSEGALPFCWLNIDHIGNGQAWHFDNPGGWPINTSTSANGFAMIDSDHYGNGGSQDADLITPVLNFTGYTSVNVYFQHYFRQYATSTGTFAYSINGGTTWSVLQTWTTTSATNPAIFNLDVSAQVAGQANVKFKWNYTGAYDYYWAVDDISITGVRPGLWTGTASSSWTSAGNWSGGIIPGSTTNVVIPFVAQFWPVYSGNFALGTQCNNLTLDGSSHFTITGTLTIPPGKSVQVNDNGVLDVGQ